MAVGTQNVSAASTADVLIPVGAADPSQTCADAGLCYIPNPVLIDVDGTVTWTNNDSAIHTVTSGTPGSPDGLFDSGIFSTTQTFSQVFSQLGSFDYFCQVHPWMLGVVTVQETVEVDSDGDGYTTDGSGLGFDCDDTNPAINPGATEIFGNDVDENCDGIISQYPTLDDPFPAKIPLGDIHIGLELISDQLISPVHLTHAGDASGRLFVVDQPGEIRVIDSDGQLLPAPFLDIKDRIVSPLGIIGTYDANDFDERGLLGLAFHPGFGDDASDGFGKIYTYSSEPVNGPADFTVIMPDTDGDGTADPFDNQAVIAEWTVDTNDPNLIDPNSRRELIRIDDPQFNHNGGMMQFGPDGYLYVSIGDGGNADDEGPGHGDIGNGQDLSTVFGSIIRIDPLDPTSNASGDPVSANGNYRIPSDNPFLGDASALDEIFAYGFRNPWRFSFDDATGQMVVADVGQNKVEEINIVNKGENYGWNIKEGQFRFIKETGQVSDDLTGLPAGLVDPVAQYDHDEGISITGGYVYRGSEIPQLDGLYVFGDFTTSFFAPDGRVFYVDLGDGMIKEFVIDGGALGTFVKSTGQDENGELYLLVGTNLGPYPDGSGTPLSKVLKIVPSADADSDGIPDGVDNCPARANQKQLDFDSDGLGDACDSDIDNDTVPNGQDNCPRRANTDQKDTDGDKKGDMCDADLDGDGILNHADNCARRANPNQFDIDGDGKGDACDNDIDNDTVLNGQDNCPFVANQDQANADGDGKGDACDAFPDDPSK